MSFVVYLFSHACEPYDPREMGLTPLSPLFLIAGIRSAAGDEPIGGWTARAGDEQPVWSGAAAAAAAAAAAGERGRPLEQLRRGGWWRATPGGLPPAAGPGIPVRAGAPRRAAAAGPPAAAARAAELGARAASAAADAGAQQLVYGAGAAPAVRGGLCDERLSRISASPGLGHCAAGVRRLLKAHGDDTRADPCP